MGGVPRVEAGKIDDAAMVERTQNRARQLQLKQLHRGGGQRRVEVGKWYGTPGLGVAGEEEFLGAVGEFEWGAGCGLEGGREANVATEPDVELGGLAGGESSDERNEDPIACHVGRESLTLRQVVEDRLMAGGDGVELLEERPEGNELGMIGRGHRLAGGRQRNRGWIGYGHRRAQAPHDRSDSVLGALAGGRSGVSPAGAGATAEAVAPAHADKLAALVFAAHRPVAEVLAVVAEYIVKILALARQCPLNNFFGGVGDVQNHLAARGEEVDGRVEERFNLTICGKFFH
jgi:hypothetical protein